MDKNFDEEYILENERKRPADQKTVNFQKLYSLGYSGTKDWKFWTSSRSVKSFKTPKRRIENNGWKNENSEKHRKKTVNFHFWDP